MSIYKGADVELIEFCDKPEDVTVTIPNAAIINGQQVYLDADHPVKVEYDQSDKDGQLAVVTLRLQVRRLVIEPRRETDITNVRPDNNGAFLTRLLDRIEEATERRNEYSKASILSDREVGTLSSDWNNVTVADELGVTYWALVKPFANEATGRSSVVRHV